ncbi:MAG: hypothetical protein KDC84_02230 [Crocinitomicaceae bacterium]|nr:hypothetical protein [Crocinitomicaceae bacterium]
MKIYALLFIVLLSTSCTKRRSVRISVYNPITGERYENIHGGLSERKKDGIFLGLYNNSKWQTVENFVTDINGEAGFTYKFLHNHAYFAFIEYSKDEFELYKINSQIAYSQKAKFGYAEFQLIPLAKIKLNIRNVNCQGAQDTMKLYRVFQLDSDSGNPQNFYGCYDFMANYYSKIKMGEWRYEWEVIRNGISTFHDTTFYLNENDSIEVNIFY